MRHRVALVVMGGLFLLATGFTPGALPFAPGAPYSDATLSHFPAALHLRESVLSRGEFPLWRDGILAAQPFAANPLNKTAYPPQWLSLLLPPSLHLDVLIVLHFLLAGWGMLRWLGALGLRAESAALGALGYALSPRLIAALGAGHLDIMCAMAWQPLLMDSVRAAAQQPTVPRVLRLALVAALLVLADIRAAVFGLALAAAYLVAELVRLKSVAVLPRLLPSLPIFVLMIAALVVPVLLWQPYLSRAGMSYSDAGVFSLELGQVAGILGVPAHRGTHEFVTFAGLPLFALALVGVLSQPRRLVFWWGAALLAALYALGANAFLWTALARLVPALLWFRVPARAWLIVALVVPLLAADGLDALITRLSRPPAAQGRARLLTLIGMVIGFAGGGFMLTSLPALRDTAFAWLLLGAFSAVVFASLLLRVPAALPAFAVLLVVFLDLALFGRRWLEWRAEPEWLNPPDSAELVSLLEGNSRVYAPYYQVGDTVISSLPQQTAAHYGVRLFNGVDPFQLTGVLQAVSQASGVSNAGYDVVAPPIIPAGQDGVGDTETLAQWDVAYVLAPIDIDNPRLTEIGRVGENRVYANLDHTPPAALSVYGWHDAAPNLPDVPTVERINQLTLLSYAVSAITFTVVCVYLLVVQLKANRQPL